MHQNFQRKSLLLAAVVVPALLAGCAAGGSTTAMGQASPPTETTSPMPTGSEMSPVPTGSEMSPAPSESPAEQGSPKAAVQAYFEALKAGDADKAVAAYTPDGLAAIQGMETAQGTEALTKLYKDMAKGKSTATNKIEESGAAGDWAFVRATSEKDGETTREFFILKKAGGEWKIDRYMSNSPS
ncbi:nuclear transport factor 2 family protein [Nonomuraea sp. NPDC048916]|uniref:YybH family protein n=1 Tax=Nonomuraea sp. NPDC048916 TaxID=3154232 RepID=UPI0033DAF90E